MEGNPYETPAEGAPASLPVNRAGGVIEVVLCCPLVLFVGVSILHRSQFGHPEAYFRAVWVLPMAAILLAALLVIPVALIRAIVLVVQRRYRLSLVNISIAAIVFPAIFLGIKLNPWIFMS